MSQCYIAGPNDDAPTPPKQQPSPTSADLHRERDILHMHGGNVVRMVEGFRASDGSYTPAVRRMTLAATRNAIEAYAKTLDAIEAEVLPVRAVPIAKPFGRRIRDADLPAVVSTGAF